MNLHASLLLVLLAFLENRTDPEPQECAAQGRTSEPPNITARERNDVFSSVGIKFFQRK